MKNKKAKDGAGKVGKPDVVEKMKYVNFTFRVDGFAADFYEKLLKEGRTNAEQFNMWMILAFKSFLDNSTKRHGRKDASWIGIDCPICADLIVSNIEKLKTDNAGITS